MKLNASQKRNFEATLIIEVETPTLREGLAEAKKLARAMGEVIDVKPVKSVRTLRQNSALWLMFTQLSEDLNERGIDIRELIRKEIQISWTPYNINQYLWKPLLKALTGKNSTTKMDKIGDIELVYDQLNKILIERTNGEVSMPVFPNIDNAIDKENTFNPNV